MPRDTRSKDDMLVDPQLIIQEAQFEEGPSEWLKNDLNSLVQSPLEVQLCAILGATDADSFLNPTIKDKKRVILANSGINVAKKHDAHELWNSLRLQSQRKLHKEERNIPENIYIYQNKRAPDNKILRSIQFSRHRTELMHSVAQLNRDKTKELLKDFSLPSFINDISDITGSGTEDIMQNKQVLSEAARPGDEDPIAILYPEENKLVNTKKSENSVKVRFLSEEDCRCSGQFKERMQNLGVIVNSGVSMMDNEYKNSNTSLTQSEHRNVSNSQSVASQSLKGNPSWQPLTFNAMGH